MTLFRWSLPTSRAQVASDGDPQGIVATTTEAHVENKVYPGFPSRSYSTPLWACAAVNCSSLIVIDMEYPITNNEATTDPSSHYASSLESGSINNHCHARNSQISTSGLEKACTVDASTVHDQTPFGWGAEH